MGVALGAALLLPGAVAAQDYHSDIRPLLQSNCLGCHSEDGVGFSMEDATDTYARRRAIGAAILKKEMPPWLAEGGHQEYVDDLSLDSELVDIVQRWVDAGYPRGEAQPEPEFVASTSTFEVDFAVDLMPGQSYLPNQSRADDYRCFLVDWPAENPGYLTGFRTDPGNLQVAHHTVVYAVRPDMAAQYRKLDEAEEGLGYQCFGGALPDRFGSQETRDAFEAANPGLFDQIRRANFWLAHWAPGMDGYDFPEGTGIRMDPGTLMVVQMHYYSEHAPGESDQGTVLELQVADDVERPAFHYPLTGDGWTNGRRNGSIVVPAGEQATVETSVALGDLVGYVSRVTQVPRDSIRALELHSANLHMHSYGHSGTITLTHADGGDETLLEVPKWNLNWQRDFTFAQPKIFERYVLDGTRLSVRCTFENLTEKTVYGGLGSDDEMCFNFSYIAVQKGTVSAEAQPPHRR